MGGGGQFESLLAMRSPAPPSTSGLLRNVWPPTTRGWSDDHRGAEHARSPPEGEALSRDRPFGLVVPARSSKTEQDRRPPVSATCVACPRSPILLVRRRPIVRAQRSSLPSRRGIVFIPGRRRGMATKV